MATLSPGALHDAAQDAILVDVSGAASTKFQSSGSGRGGSDTSIDANNVFALQPRVYVEGSDPEGDLAHTPCSRLRVEDSQRVHPAAARLRRGQRPRG